MPSAHSTHTHTRDSGCNGVRQSVTRQKHSIKKYSGNQRHAALVGSHCSQLQESESAGKRGVTLRTAESKAGLISNEFECRFLKKSGNISEKNELKKRRGNKKRGSIYVQSRVF